MGNACRFRSIRRKSTEHCRVLAKVPANRFSSCEALYLAYRDAIVLPAHFTNVAYTPTQAEKDEKTDAENISAVQGNILYLPFADETFDLVLTCGVLEYVPLDEGLKEMARVLKSGAKLVLIPVKPSLVGAVLEILYKFKTHSIEEVRQVSGKYFRIVGDSKFPITEPIGWSKMIFLLEKK